METDTKQQYKISWQTEIIDGEEWEGVPPRRIPVEGWTIIDVEGFNAAMVTAESMCDVDFFVPEEKYSASDRDVKFGQMWRTDAPGAVYPSLSGLLPEVDTWNFDDIEITGIAKVQP
jgi:hypothetical protein